jgi:hypothetical protein
VSKRGGTEDVTLEAIKNDDVQALRRIPTELARAARTRSMSSCFDFFRVNGLIYDAKALPRRSQQPVHGRADGCRVCSASLAMLKQTEQQRERAGHRPGSILVPFELR